MSKARLSSRTKFFPVALATFVAFALNGVARASTIDYTFTGVGSNTVSGPSGNEAFAGVTFTASFVLDPSTITGAGGYYLYEDVSGSFTEGGGAYSTTLTDVTIEVNGNGNTGSGAYETLYLFNSDFGSAIGFNSDASLLGYALTAPFTTGSVTGSEIGAYQDLAGFSTTTGDTVEFTGLSSLDFTASVPGASPIPEPSTLSLLVAGLCLFGVGLFRRWAIA
jgi:hypothetical protein